LVRNEERHGGYLKRLKIMNKVEFFDIENFSSLHNFLDKAYTYQLFFNLVRPDTYKENKTPRYIVKEKKS